MTLGSRQERREEGNAEEAEVFFRTVKGAGDVGDWIDRTGRSSR